MTAEKLANVKTTLADIQTRMLAIFKPTTILVGHSLENDLRVLRLIHTRVIDTSLIFSHFRGPPYKPGLKWLAEKFLHVQIQGGMHDSVEDARCCVDLVKLKIKNGTFFVCVFFFVFFSFFFEVSFAMELWIFELLGDSISFSHGRQKKKNKNKQTTI
jgi:DNA polymerase III epsilon subunit-like protein